MYGCYGLNKIGGHDKLNYFYFIFPQSFVLFWFKYSGILTQQFYKVILQTNLAAVDSLETHKISIIFVFYNAKPHGSIHLWL